jgi:RNA polymerase sigma-70 factor (ECF subfamily)
MAEKKVTPAAARRRRVTNSAAPHPSTQDTDEYAALVREAADGDPVALERLLMRAQEAAWRFSSSVCGRGNDAEDAMQEALIKTYRYVERIRDPQAFRAWLYRTVRNACLMGRRKKVGEPTRLQSLDDVLPGRFGPLEHELPDPGRDPEALAENAVLRRRLRRAMAGLPAPYRAVIFLREMEGLSTREAAQALGISEDNVKARLHRARLQLQAGLSKERT